MDGTDASLPRQVGVAVTAWMKASGLTPSSLHKRTGLSRETIYRVQRGETEPTLDVLRRIAAEVGATLGQLIDGIGPDGAVATLPASGGAGTGSRSLDNDPTFRELRRDVTALAREVKRLRGLVEPSASRTRRRAG